jgi:hypothetical protein
MKFMTLDLAKRTGICVGTAGEKPRAWSERLANKDESYPEACAKLSDILVDWLRLESPDMLVVEDFLQPGAHRSGHSVIMQLHLHGVARAIAHRRSVPVKVVNVDKVRVHLCGKKSALPITRGPKTSRQKQEARDETKRMVLKQCKLLGLIPKFSDDTDASDAAALWEFACAHFARATPPSLVMFDEGEKP